MPHFHSSMRTLTPLQLALSCLAASILTSHAEITVTSVTRYIKVSAVAASTQDPDIVETLNGSGACNWNYTRSATGTGATANATAVQDSTVTVTATQLEVSGSISESASATSSGATGPTSFEANTYLEVNFSVSEPTPFSSNCSASGAVANTGGARLSSDGSDIYLSEGDQPRSGVLIAGITYTLRFQASGNGGTSNGGYSGASSGSATFQFQASKETPLIVAQPGKYSGVIRQTAAITSETVSGTSTLRVSGRMATNGRLILVDSRGAIHTIQLLPDNAAKVRQSIADPILAGSYTVSGRVLNVLAQTTETRSDEIANLSESHSYRYVLRRVGN